MKGRHRAKIEILNEILNWIELGKSFEDIQHHCSLSIDYHDMHHRSYQRIQIRSLFVPVEKTGVPCLMNCWHCNY